MQDNNIRFEKAIESFERHNYQYTIVLCFQILAVNPDYPECRHLLHKAQQNQYLANKNNITYKITSLFKKGYFAILALFYKLSKNDNVLIITLDKQLSDNPYSVKLYEQLGLSLVRANMQKSAQKVFEELYQINADNLIALENLAQILFEKADWKNALLTSERACKLDPGNAVCTKIIKDVHAKTTIESNFQNTDDNDFKIKF